MSFFGKIADLFGGSVVKKYIYIAIAVMILIVLMIFGVNKTLDKFGFTGSKDKLIKDNATYVGIIKTMNLENLDLKKQLDRCENQCKIGQDVVNGFNTSKNSIDYSFDSILSKRDGEINKLMSLPPNPGPSTVNPPTKSTVLTKPVPSTSPSIQRKISEIQINSLWEAYDEANKTTK